MMKEFSTEGKNSINIKTMTPNKEEEPETAELKSDDEPPSYRQSSFPEKLISILDDQDKYGDIITWVPDGKLFVVRSPERLVEEVLPNYFDRHCSFGSFVRKLYYWGFKKTGMNAPSQSIGDNEIGFFHAVSGSIAREVISVV